MPNLTEFKNIIETVMLVLQADLRYMQKVIDYLPEAPDGIEYMQLGSFENRRCAPLAFRTTARDRTAAVDLIAALKPIPLVSQPEGVPLFAPSHGIDHQFSYTPIFPIVFAAHFNEYLPQESQHQSDLFWYHKTKDGVPLLIITTIANDACKLYAQDVVNAPRGGIVECDTEVKNGYRSCTAYWPKALKFMQWREDFVDNDIDDIWAEEIHEREH